MGKRYYGNMNYIPKHPDFKNPDVWQDLKRQCYDGTIEYANFPAAEYRYFDKLRMIYLEYKFAGLPKEEAAAREQKIFSDYRDDKRRDGVVLEVYTVYQDNIRRFSSAKIGINKCTDPQEKLRLALEAVGCATNDNIFAKINLEEIGKEYNQIGEDFK